MIVPAGLKRPRHLPDDHWVAISAEHRRVQDALDVDDASAFIGSLKSLVESVARVVLDVAGEPAESNASFEGTLNRAHDLIVGQKGFDLADNRPFALMASQAKKMAANLGNVRNEFGTGHGRAGIPLIKDEMVSLSASGTYIWVEWAIRRLDPFTAGRPVPLIDDLRHATFTKGSLAHRLDAANLPNLEPHHQRALGVAVGQRVTSGTFVVQWDGLDPAIATSELEPWTRDYRLGLATGLLEGVDARPTLTSRSFELALEALAPVEDWTGWLDELVSTMESTSRQHLPNDWGELVRLEQIANDFADRRSGEAGTLLHEIAEKFRALMFFAENAPDVGE